MRSVVVTYSNMEQKCRHLMEHEESQRKGEWYGLLSAGKTNNQPWTLTGDEKRVGREISFIKGENKIHTFALLMYSFSNGVAGCSRLSSTKVNGDAPSR